jgi:hypothetical protein
MEGDLESIIEPLVVEQPPNQLTELNATLGWLKQRKNK